MSDLTFREDDHTYWRDGKRVPNVTEIMRPLVNFDWISEQVLERKSAIGRAVHLATEIHDLGGEFAEPLHAIVQPYFDAYLSFCDQYKPAWSEVESRVFHDTLHYAGTLDRFGAINGTPTVLDIKCVAQVHPAAFVQCSAYEEALEHPRANRLILQLKPDGKFELHEAKSTHREDFGVFVSCLTQYRWKEKYAK